MRNGRCALTVKNPVFPVFHYEILKIRGEILATTPYNHRIKNHSQSPPFGEMTRLGVWCPPPALVG